MDFGRQPEPVTVTLDGAPEDVTYWRHELMRRAQFKDDQVVAHYEHKGRFTIYPRAVND
jgi:hypothetical protein